MTNEQETGKCHYCGKERPLSELHEGTIEYIGYDHRSGRKGVLRRTYLYCNGTHCHGYDQMGHEG